MVTQSGCSNAMVTQLGCSNAMVTHSGCSNAMVTQPETVRLTMTIVCRGVHVATGTILCRGVYVATGTILCRGVHVATWRWERRAASRKSLVLPATGWEMKRWLTAAAKAGWSHNHIAGFWEKTVTVY